MPPSIPPRVVSLLASGTEIVCALGMGDCLVGRSHECDNPAWVRRLPACTRPAFAIDASSADIDAEVRRRVEAGQPLYDVDAALLARLAPDVLISQSHCEVCAVTPRDLDRAGCFPGARMVALAASTLADIFTSVGTVAEALGVTDAAARLVAQMQERMAAVRDFARSRPVASVVVLEWTVPTFTAANWTPELVKSAGGCPVLSDGGRHSRARPWQEVLEADPDCLIVAPCGYDLERTQAEIPVLEALPGWQHLRAVREGRVALADGNRYFNRSGATVVETVELLGEVLHGYPAGLEGLAWSRYRPAQAIPPAGTFGRPVRAALKIPGAGR